jgi:hypothetical protein
MKWIGQQIYDQIFRFRDDVYLEDLSTTTETSVLVVDSNGKISKSTTLADDIIESEIDTLAGLSAIGSAGTPLNITSDTVTFTSSNADDPAVIIENTTVDDQAARLQFKKHRGVDAVDGDNIGEIEFWGYDDGTPSVQQYAKITVEIDDATSGQESGKIMIGVANHDGGQNAGLVLTGGSESNEVDAILGHGTNSVVTIPGDIDVDGTMEADAITLGGTALGSLYSPIAGSSSIVTTGTIETGVWQGTAIASAYLDADTAHLSSTRQITYHNYRANQGTTKTYLGLADADSEGTSTTNVDIPFTAPFAGKLLKIFLKSNKNLSSHTLTWRLETQATGVTFSTGPTIVGTQSGAGCTNSSITNYDFTSSLDSGDNIIDAGDTLYLSLQSNTDFGSNVIYYITCLWEWNLS